MSNKADLMFAAAKSGSVERIRQAFDSGTSVNVHNPNIGKTPLHLAAEFGHSSVIIALHGLGADLTGRDFLGGTPAHCAAMSNHPDAIRTLYELGADLSVKDCMNAVPSVWAARNCCMEALSVLHELGAPVTTPPVLTIAAINDHAPVLRFVHDLGVDILAVASHEGDPLLHDAARTGSVSVLKLLHDFGDDFSRRDGLAGAPPLQVAARRGHVDATRVILSFGVDIAAVDEDGCTALGTAITNGHLGW